QGSQNLNPKTKGSRPMKRLNLAAIAVVIAMLSQGSLSAAEKEPAAGGFKYHRLDKNNAAVLLVDHQSGLISLVQDFSPGEFKNNVLALADLAKYFKLPV